MADLHHIRKCDSRSAIVFLHGFTGDPDGTWANLPLHLAAEPSLAQWNILNVGYNSSLLPGTRGLWASDADLPTLSTLFFTELDIAPLAHYTDIAVVAHSMGGLIAQSALVRNRDLIKRVRHLFLFGTPSAGIRKANFLSTLFGPFVGAAVRNMATDSPFITNLRAGWTETFGETLPFQFLTIAGDKDSFVVSESSLQPFAQSYRRVISGDHLSMVKPRDPSADVVRLLISAFTQHEEPEGPASVLRMAAELGNAEPRGMAVAQDALGGRHPLTTQAEVVEAALALDRAGYRQDAIKLLETHQSFGTDVKGAFAGRIKRRWIQEGREEDAHWALGLYASGLETALNATPRTQDAIGQIFYHAINVAFLKLVAFGQFPAAREMAGVALAYAKKAQPPDLWSVATEAEAWLYLGDDEEALAQYQHLVATSTEKWKLMSTGQQAQQIAAKAGNVALEQQLRDLFEPPIHKLAASTKR